MSIYFHTKPVLTRRFSLVICLFILINPFVIICWAVLWKHFTSAKLSVCQACCNVLQLLCCQLCCSQSIKLLDEESLWFIKSFNDFLAIRSEIWWIHSGRHKLADYAFVKTIHDLTIYYHLYNNNNSFGLKT